MKYGHHQRAYTLYTTDISETIEMHKVRVSCLFSLFSVIITIYKIVDGVHLVCMQMVAILYIETFVTFDFDPSLISRLITDSNLD